MSDKIPYAELKTIADVHGPFEVEKQVHINHDDCPAGTDTKERLYILNTGEVTLFCCHHCGGKGYLRNEKRIRRPEEIVVHKGEGATYPGELVSVDPSRILDKFKTANYISTSTPMDMQLWLFSYGFDYAMCRDYGIRADSGGIYLPTYTPQGSLHTIQKRVFGNISTNTKYITAKVHVSATTPEKVPTILVRKHASTGSGIPTTVVLTEDILSAYKVSAAGYTAIPLLGTTLPNEAIGYLLRTKLVVPSVQIVVWLDKDTAGCKGSVEVVKTLHGLGFDKVWDVSNMYDQPKECELHGLASALGSY